MSTQEYRYKESHEFDSKYCDAKKKMKHQNISFGVFTCIRDFDEIKKI